MKVYEQIHDMLCDELGEIAKKKELTTSSLDIIYKSVDVLKDIKTIESMEIEYPSYSQDGYSRDGYSQGYWGRMPVYAYDDGMSHRGARRDSMGRYSEGYSGDTREELTRLMNAAQNDRERDAIRKALDSMR